VASEAAEGIGKAAILPRSRRYRPAMEGCARAKLRGPRQYDRAARVEACPRATQQDNMAKPLVLYDNYTRSLRTFEPLKTDAVGLYTCGPTVYDYQHIGNFRTFLFEDLLRRILEWNGYTVRHVMNITDVGHLTSDADTGEDKMETGSRRTGKTAWQIAELYTESFLTDMKALNIEPPTILCRATDHIAEQIAFIADIEKNGYTYRTSDGIYFDTSRQPDYGYLARLDRAGLEAGKRVDPGEKRSATDFALWKFSRQGEKRQMEWDSPWGTGFPGWHIECSAMAQKYLGDYFDIHCGGEDHIPVHHTNEIAQTEARVGTRLANFWTHGYFLLSNDAKMAKSAGAFLRLQTLIDRGYDPLAYRYLCLTAHYRSQLNFTWDALDAAATGLDRLRQGVFGLRGSDEADARFLERFTAEINEDLNVPRALALAWEVLRGDQPVASRRATLIAFDRVFGLGLSGWRAREETIPEPVHALAAARLAARQAKQWAEADRLRAELHAAGWEVEDRADGYSLKRR
jgi:cysteinyl-tRNA synthetase